ARLGMRLWLQVGTVTVAVPIFWRTCRVRRYDAISSARTGSYQRSTSSATGPRGDQVRLTSVFVASTRYERRRRSNAFSLATLRSGAAWKHIVGASSPKERMGEHHGFISALSVPLIAALGLPIFTLLAVVLTVGLTIWGVRRAALRQSAFQSAS